MHHFRPFFGEMVTSSQETFFVFKIYYRLFYTIYYLCGTAEHVNFFNPRIFFFLSDTNIGRSESV